MKQQDESQIDLKRELASLKLTMDEVGAYIFTKDREGRYTFANRLVTELFGLPLEELIGKDDSQFFDDARASQLRINDRLVIEEGQTIEGEERLVPKGGSEARIYLAVKKPLRDETGQITGMCGVSTDVTERKRAEDALRHELAVSRELLNAEDRKHEQALLGDSIAMHALREGIEQNAKGDWPLLLTGESGSGHEAVARAVHRQSKRSERPFIKFDCAHSATVEDSLFGHSERQFEKRLGKVRLADGGTLFLESIEKLGKREQVSLLAFLNEAAEQQGVAVTPTPDVRVIAATSADLRSDVQRGSLDPELFSILNAERLKLPSLSDRREDIMEIANFLLERRAASVGKTLTGFTQGSQQMLTSYSWPGNIRELASVVERSVLLAGGTTVEVPPDLLLEGRRIGGYTLVRLLGSGAMGEVWLARHALLARPSAVKLIKHGTEDAQLGGTRKLLEKRFRNEATATAQLRSPHTVELYDFGVTDNGDFYYVMEFLDGIDLESLVVSYGRVEPARAVYLLKQACMSLGEAHSAGLVHRDVKPANLITCRLGPHYDFLKLLDFGIVKAAGAADVTATNMGTLKGTPTTMAPEVIQGEEASPAADIYGLGCTAYWLLSGHHVFEATQIVPLLMNHVSKPPVPLSDRLPNLPSELNDLVLTCLAKNPADRPRDAFEVNAALASINFKLEWNGHQAASWWQKTMPTASLHEQSDPFAATIHSLSGQLE